MAEGNTKTPTRRRLAAKPAPSQTDLLPAANPAPTPDVTPAAPVEAPEILLTLVDGKTIRPRLRFSAIRNAEVVTGMSGPKLVIDYFSGNMNPMLILLWSASIAGPNPPYKEAYPGILSPPTLEDFMEWLDEPRLDEYREVLNALVKESYPLWMAEAQENAPAYLARALFGDVAARGMTGTPLAGMLTDSLESAARQNF